MLKMIRGVPRSWTLVGCASPGSAGRYWKSTGSLTSRSDGRRSCILTLTGSERLVLRYGGVRNTMATCLWTSAWEKVPFPSQESWKKRTSMSSAGEWRQTLHLQLIKSKSQSIASFASLVISYICRPHDKVKQFPMESQRCLISGFTGFYHTDVMCVFLHWLSYRILRGSSHISHV